MKKVMLLIAMFGLFSAFGSETFAQDKPDKIEIRLLQSLVRMTDGVLMMKLKDGQLVALDADRNVLYPYGYKTPPKEEPFYVYSVGDLMRLIFSQEIKAKLNKDIKAKKLSLDSGDDGEVSLQTLRMMIPSCPPACR